MTSDCTSRLTVLDETGKPVGIISNADLIYADDLDAADPFLSATAAATVPAGGDNLELSHPSSG